MDIPQRTLRRRQGMQAWYVRVCWAVWGRAGGEALEPAADMVAMEKVCGFKASACDG